MRPGAALNARIDELTRKIDALLANSGEALKRAEALQRAQTSGELALPLSTEQVAIVCNSTTNAVGHWVHRRILKKRFINTHFAFHPDDVRAFLQTQRNLNRERINAFLDKKRPDLREVLNGVAEDHT